MSRLNRLPAIACFVALFLGALRPSFADSSNALLDRMAEVNPHLRAFTATLHAEVTMRSFPFLGGSRRNVLLQGPR